jgi:hypothetical protein
MTKFSKIIPVIAVGVALSVSACSKQTFVLDGGGSRVAKDASSVFFVGGIGQSQRINVAQICGGKGNVASVEAEQTFMNGLINALTSGIYSPRQYRVVCNR